MSEISSSCTVHAVMADYAAIDAAGKVNVIGGGISFVGFDSIQGISTPFALFVQVVTPLKSIHETDAVLEIELTDLNGNPINIPSPTGEPNPLRITQIIEFKMNQPAGTEKPVPAFPSTAAVAMNFANGLPLTAGEHYTWSIKIDHEIKGKAFFMVPRPTALPVLG